MGGDGHRVGAVTTVACSGARFVSAEHSFGVDPDY